MTTATHWMPDVFASPEEWPDNPQQGHAAAANLLLDEKDDAGWHAWDELRTTGFLTIQLNGFIETREDPGENHGMDGYEPGDSWFKPTGEKKFVRVTLKLEIDQ